MAAYLIAPSIGLIALICAGFLISWINKKDPGDAIMQKIASFISKGAQAFLSREYKYIAIFIVCMFLILTFISKLGLNVAIMFLCGAIFSLMAGYIGMITATQANVRTAAEARNNSMTNSLKVAFRGGAVMGLCVVGLGLFGVGGLFAILGVQNAELLTGFSLGASSIALFGRVGGGIYTKAADIGADLVGKVEAGIPEDDPRNPAVIADNVGDNVGDVAGMGSDLFESYVGAIVSAITLAVSIGSINAINGCLFPLILAGIGIVSSIVAIFLVGISKNAPPEKSLNTGTYISAGICLVSSFFLSRYMFNGSIKAFLTVSIGIMIGILIGALTEFYTSGNFKPVRNLAKQCETGSATCIINGFALGMESTAFPIFIIALGIIASYCTMGLYGITLAAVGMLSTSGMTIAVDAYGPIADNAGGIAQMSNLPSSVRHITDKLDSVGNTTAAIGKGFAIGSAALTSLALFVSYSQTARIKNIDLLNPLVVSGLLIGAMLPFLFSAMTTKSVGKAAFKMIAEVRQQFKSNPNILNGTKIPDYTRCVDISTKAALHEMILPSLISIASPLAIGLILGVEALGGMLAGALASGVLLAIMMSNSGGAWDNAKKYIEEYGDKGSDPHKASVVGDTVGDPFKDTSGPSINILIKLITIIALVFLPLFI